MPARNAKAPKVTSRTAAPPHATQCGTLALVFGDQLDPDSPAIAELDVARDAILMVEVAHESRHVPSHVQRTVLFLSAMRHFAAELRAKGLRVEYVSLANPANTGSFDGEIHRAIAQLRPKTLACVRPGEWRVLELVRTVAREADLPLVVHEDPHFFTTPSEFAAWAKGRKALTMEFFYREQRRKTGYLMVGKGRTAKPEGDTWNYDAENRLSFAPKGPTKKIPRPPRFAPDAITREVIANVARVLPDLPGVLASPDDFAWAVTREDARACLDDFINNRLAGFGPYEDAMWTTEPTVYHSMLSPLLNLKLLNPRACCDAAIAAYRDKRVPLQSAEAFVRQLIGWREFIRGVYWLEGPHYAQRNTLNSHGALPWFYWDGKTDMNCLRHTISQVVNTSFAHHIQRLMVMGNFALISGVHPKAVSDWYLGMFADGVDWVTLPNTLGMMMHADARPREHPDHSPGSTGLVGTKPYAASGKYIQRMSDYCRGCVYDPAQKSGPKACPFNVFYWNFLITNREKFGANQRMAMIVKNVDRMSQETRVQITTDAALLRKKFGIDQSAPGRSGM